MKINRKTITLAAVISLCFAMVGMVAAQGFGPGRGKGPGIYGQRGPKGMMRPPAGMRGQRRDRRDDGIMGELRGLNLTDGQKEQIRSVMQANRPTEAERTELQGIMRAMRDGTATEQQRARAKELSAIRIDREANVRQQVRGILTQDQLATLDKRERLREERMEKMRERRKGRPDRND
jgi:Spy/CpxP family protein refolding chaperone